MKTAIAARSLVSVAALSLVLTVQLEAAVVSVPANKDNTIYSEGSDVSNGAGDNFFAGTTSVGNMRRALISFPVADSLPSCVVVQSVTLVLYMSKTIALTETVTLQKLLADWGEGTSDATAQEGRGASATPGDATWTYSFYNTTTWAAPGGDCAAAASATQDVTGIGFYTWTGPQLVADVQGWANNPATNFGWMVIGEEGASATAKRFASRTNPAAANQPVLQIGYFDCTSVEAVTWGTIKSCYR